MTELEKLREVEKAARAWLDNVPKECVPSCAGAVCNAKRDLRAALALRPETYRESQARIFGERPCRLPVHSPDGVLIGECQHAMGHVGPCEVKP